MAKRSTLEYDRCLLVVNPAGSSYRKGLKLRGSLERAFADRPLTTLRLTQSELAHPSNLRRELKKLTTDSLLTIIGGDGTVNMVMSELLKVEDSGPRHTTVLPLWGGNACDLAHMANGRRRNSVRLILRNGKRTPAHPMKFTLTNSGKTESGLAMCYISFGAVASTADVLDNSRLIRLTAGVPAVRLLAEVGVGLVGLIKAKRFQTKAGEKLYDLLLINGPRIAKLYRTPAKLSAPDFVELRVKHKYPVLLTHVTKLTRIWVRSATVKKRQLTLTEPTWMQYDGEVRQLKKQTTVLIEPARQSVYLLTTK